MPRTCLLIALLAAPALAAPVPKPDPELERITKAYGTVHDREGAALSTDAKGALTVKLEKARPPKEPKPGQKDAGLKLPQPTSVALGRTAKGEFTATARFELKTDLTRRADDMGVSVSMWVEYPTGVSASIGCSFSSGPGAGPPDAPQQNRVVAGFGTHTNDGTPGGFRGKTTIGFPMPSGTGPQYLRVRCTGKVLVLEASTDGTKWERHDELAIKETDGATIKLHVMSSHGAETEVVIDRFEVK